MARTFSAVEIAAFRQRSQIGVGTLSDSALLRVRDIRLALDGHPDKAFLDPYYVVGLCTSLEWFCRENVKSVCDLFPDKAVDLKQLLPDQRINFDLVLSLKENAFTLGDLFAFSLTVSNVESFCRCIEILYFALTGKKDNFRKIMANSKNFEEKRYDFQMKLLQQLFDLRHQIVHEIPAGIAGTSKHPLVLRERLSAVTFDIQLFLLSLSATLALQVAILDDERRGAPYEILADIKKAKQAIRDQMTFLGEHYATIAPRAAKYAQKRIRIQHQADRLNRQVRGETRIAPIERLALIRGLFQEAQAYLDYLGEELDRIKMSDENDLYKQIYSTQ